MTDIAKLRELLARVESATGGDCKLEDDIAISLLGWRYHNFTDDHGEWRDEKDKYAMCPDAYTSSIDAAVALCERVLPGCSLLMAKNPNSAIANVHTMPIGISGEWFDCGKQATLPLSLCSAILRAKIAMLEKDAA